MFSSNVWQFKKIKVVQGVWSFLPPPNFPMCQNPEKKSPKLASPKKWQSPGLATPKLTRVGDSDIFWGWQVLDSAIFWGGQFRTLFFSGFWHIGKLGGGKKDQTPCMFSCPTIGQWVSNCPIITQCMSSCRSALSQKTPKLISTSVILGHFSQKRAKMAILMVC